MRDLNLEPSKTRRSSFSNTLSQLPEVEESFHADVVSPVPEAPSETTICHDKLPPLTNVEPLVPTSRPFIHPLPTGSKTHNDIERPALRRRLSSEQPAAKGTNIQKGPALGKSSSRGFYVNLSQPYVTSIQVDVRRPEGSRRWSIGAPVSQVEHETELSARRLNSKGNVEKKTCQGSQDLESKSGTTFNEKDTQGNVSNSSWNRIVSQRKFSEPSLVLGEKERLEILEDPALNRRWSNPTFAETAKKANMVLRLGRNMRKKIIPSETKLEERKTIRTLADFAVDMPKSPRFSTMMSPEAQFSLMMGYEDKIYDKFINQCPEYYNALKRNKTPVEKVYIRRKNFIGFPIDDNTESCSDSEEDDKASEPNDSTRSSFLTQPTESSSCQSLIEKTLLGAKYHQHRGSIQSLNSSTSEFPERPDSQSTLRNLRRLSISLEKKHYLNRLFDKVDDEANETVSSYGSIQRSCSLPNVGDLPFSRRLMMTHRLESAMDILDAMKCHGELFLSPRLRRKKSIPLADYNSWVHEWNKEFRVENEKT